MGFRSKASVLNQGVGGYAGCQGPAEEAGRLVGFCFLAVGICNSSLPENVTANVLMNLNRSQQDSVQQLATQNKICNID